MLSWLQSGCGESEDDKRRSGIPQNSRKGSRKGEAHSEVTWVGEAEHMTMAFPPYNEGKQTYKKRRASFMSLPVRSENM